MSVSVVDTYLKHRFGVRLSQLLLEGIATRNALWVYGVSIDFERVGSFAGAGGATQLYQGMLTIEGVSYRIRFTVDVIDDQFARIGDINEFEMMSWTVRLRVGGQDGPARDIGSW